VCQLSAVVELLSCRCLRCLLQAVAQLAVVSLLHCCPQHCQLHHQLHLCCCCFHLLLLHHLPVEW
jgi:hypothetical protein